MAGAAFSPSTPPTQNASLIAAHQLAEEVADAFVDVDR
jgi:hypothetical protein